MKIIKNSLDFIKESKKYIFLVVFIFLLFSFIGFNFPFFEDAILGIISELRNLFEGLNLWQTIGLIFFNNARASLFAIILGVFFGVFSLIIVMTNGYLIGFVAQMVTKEYSFFEMWRILPHGIFELPAVLISIGFGLKIGIEILTKPKSLINNLDESLKTFVIIILPLLLLAAIIEGLLIFYG